MWMQSARSCSARKMAQVAASVFLLAAFCAAAAEADPLSCNHIKTDGQPGIDNWKPIVDAMKKGDYFVSSGEVLIPSYAVQGTGKRRTIAADVEWTFPLEFAEVVWGDGQKTDRQIIPVTDLPAFGKHHFQIPFDAAGKKWVRFAVWDSAGNGAFVQPIKLPATSTTSTGGSRP